MSPLRLAAAAALAAAAPAAGSGKAELDLVQFFIGRTQGENEVRIAFRKPVRQLVQSVGRRASNGDLLLVDTIREAGKPVKTRRWLMRPDGPNRYTGTMSEAVTPVKVVIEGARATLRYSVKGGIKVEQTLTMRDRRTVVNHVAARKLGVRLGRLDGTIRKLD